MYAKVFAQILDSSIADDYELRHFFTDLLILADVNGVVDMTPTSIAARTRIPGDRVMAFLKKLSSPDPESRTPDAEGRRIILLDEHRSWGWHIVNYAKFRAIASEEQRREKTAARVARFREKNGTCEPETPCNAPVTHGNACNAMQKQKQKQKQKQSVEAEVKPENKAPDASSILQASVAPLARRFIKPSLEELRLAFSKAGAPETEAEKFFDFYESKGWMVGKSPMRRWQNAVGGWAGRWRETPKVVNGVTQTRKLSLDDEIEQLMRESSKI